jgi:phytoene dehydrogenase-like protein
MTATRDAIIVGSSPNELVAACYLAKAGQKVTIVDRRPEIGGTAALADIPSAGSNGTGFRLEVSPPTQGWLSPKIIKDLGLEGHGLATEWAEASVVTARADGPPLVLWRDQAKAREEIAKHSTVDASKWEAFSTRMARLAGFLETLYTQEPPRLMSEQAGDLFSLMAVGLRLRRLGKIDMVELLRTLPMSVQDLLDDWFESDILKGTLGAGGITNILQGPRSAGTCFVMLHHLVGRPVGGFRGRTVVRSERGQLVHVLGLAAKQLGVEVKTGTTSTILVKDGRATGIALADGEELTARYVVSGADPRRTFRELVDPIELEPEFLHAVGNVKLRGVRAVVNLALGELPAFKGVPASALSGVISTSPHLDYLERAYDDAKHGKISRALFLEATIPSLTDPSLAPDGKHVMSVAVQYAPYHLENGGWNESAKEALADRVVAMLTEVAPNLASAVVGRAVYTPVDLEASFGLTEGHLYGGELTLDQILFMRPIPGFAQYRTPIEGLFMCGDACHPGGGLPGLAGANAAREILKDI